MSYPITGFLTRLTAISPLPAQSMTYALVGIWLAGALGVDSAARWWNENAGTTTAFYSLALGIWLVPKKAAEFAESKAAAAKADAVTAKAETATAKIEANQQEVPT